MKVIYERPLLNMVRGLIKLNRDHEPAVSHIELTQAEYTKLCREIRAKNSASSPRDTTLALIVDGVHIRRVST